MFPIVAESSLSYCNVTQNGAHLTPSTTSVSPIVAESPLSCHTHQTPSTASMMSSLFEATPSKSLPAAVNNAPISSSSINSIPETLPTSVSHSTPTRKRSPLSDIGNRCGSRVLGSSPLSKHLIPVPSGGSKPTKTGHARVLTSAECMKLLEEKRREKEQKAGEKEARKREHERKKAEREELQQRKKRERLECQQQKKEAPQKKKTEAAARKLAAAGQEESYIYHKS